MPSTILIADDNANMRCLLREGLEKLGHKVREASDGAEAIKVLGRDQIDILISDLMMPNMNGLELLAHVKANHPGILSIMISAHGTVKDAVEAMKRGAVDYITKPFDFSEIEAVLRKAEALVDADEEPRGDPGGALNSILGKSGAIATVRGMLSEVAKTDSSVLLLGESGTGKELAARAIHEVSPRAAGPFIPVNCAAFSSGVLESELFGHEKGAFTGAAQLRAGRFELADGGTLFLDEIGEISPEIQVKLLRVLQERKFERVGGVREIKSDFRLISATNKNLEAEAAAGRFREDLLFRLNVIPIQLPPLRKRPEDIPLLANHFLALFSTRMGKQIQGLAGNALDCLNAYGWPGNIRELENILERALVFAKGSLIELSDLPEKIRQAAGRLPATVEEGGLKGMLKESISAIERRQIVAALEMEKSNRTNAAKRLGISRKGLQLKIKEYGLEAF